MCVGGATNPFNVRLQLERRTVVTTDTGYILP